MHYPLRSKPQKGRHYKTIVAFSLFVVLIVCMYVFPNATRTASSTIAKPLWVLRNLSVKPFTATRDFFRFKSSLISQNISLQEEVVALRLKQIDYDTILKENQDLTNLGGASADHITSRVLSKPPQSPYDTLVVDIGSVEGVMVGSVVYMSDTVIVGAITSVGSHTSVVRLFSTNGYKQQATLERTGASFELTGAGGANFQVEVPKDTDVVIGDVFLYPAHFASVLASVYYIDANSQSSFKKVYLRIPGNVFSSQWLFIERL